MQRRVWSVAIGLLALGLPASTAVAQVCRGTAPFGVSVGTDQGFEVALVLPEEGAGVAGAFKWSPDLNLALNFGGAAVFDVGGGVDVWQFGADGTYRFYAGTDAEFPLDICLLSGFLFYFMSDLPAGLDQNGFLIPLGVSLGNDFPLGQSQVRIAPYFAPVFAIQRRNGEDFRDFFVRDLDETDGLFYVDFGVSFIFPSRWYIGLGIALGDGKRVPSGDTEFRIRFGWVRGGSAIARPPRASPR